VPNLVEYVAQFGKTDLPLQYFEISRVLFEATTQCHTSEPQRGPNLPPLRRICATDGLRGPAVNGVITFEPREIRC
jgi:hypothetical protein